MLLSSGARFDAIVRAPCEFIQSLSLPGGWNMKLQNPHGDSWPKARTPAPLYWGSDVPPSPLNLLTARLRCSLPCAKHVCTHALLTHTSRKDCRSASWTRQTLLCPGPSGHRRPLPSGPSTAPARLSRSPPQPPSLPPPWAALAWLPPESPASPLPRRLPQPPPQLPSWAPPWSPPQFARPRLAQGPQSPSALPCSPPGTARLPGRAQARRALRWKPWTRCSPPSR
mmetsp:Transcript_40201/g.83853  ORF Transcript_40201/g.83853 Transcript_40201/m.83853 type:complete len:226 (+) Transcript_40201:151-828(+)